MDRREAFEALENHAWYGRHYARLRAPALGDARAFLEANEGLGKGAFEMALHRAFMDQPKPKQWDIVRELLLAANTQAGP